MNRIKSQPLFEKNFSIFSQLLRVCIKICILYMRIFSGHTHGFQNTNNYAKMPLKTAFLCIKQGHFCIIIHDFLKIALRRGFLPFIRLKRINGGKKSASQRILAQFMHFYAFQCITQLLYNHNHFRAIFRNFFMLYRFSVLK